MAKSIENELSEPPEKKFKRKLICVDFVCASAYYALFLCKVMLTSATKLKFLLNILYF